MSEAAEIERVERVEQVSVDVLIPYVRNARTHNDAQIAQLAGCIRAFGFGNPIQINEHNTVLSGHARLLAARKLGLETVPCVRHEHLSSRDERAYMLADNRIALSAGWDEEMLALELADIEEQGLDLSMLGFDPEELGRLIDPDPADVAPDVALELPEDEPVTRAGDVWQCGDHRVMCGDAANSADLDTLLEGDDAVEMLLTDPPYNVAYEGGTAEKLTIDNDDMDETSFAELLRASLSNAAARLCAGGAAYIWHATSSASSFREAFDAAGLYYSCTCIWVKSAHVLSWSDYHHRYEPCLYGWKPGAPHRWFGGRDKNNVWEFGKPQRNGDHPTMKPVDLLASLLANSSGRGDRVLDVFSGSGSTMLACEAMRRRARCLELEPRYVDASIRRWAELTGSAPKLEETGEGLAEVRARRDREVRESE